MSEEKTSHEASQCPVTESIHFINEIICQGGLTSPRSRRIAEEVHSLLDDVAWGRAGDDHMPAVQTLIQDLLGDSEEQEGHRLATQLQQTLDAYLNNKDRSDNYPVPSAHLDFLNTLQMYYQTEDYIFVHAGLREKVPLESQQEVDMLWIRDEFIYSDYDFGRRVVFGHTPFKEPLVQPNKIGIDTGAVYGGKLTCLEIPRLVLHAV